MIHPFTSFISNSYGGYSGFFFLAIISIYSLSILTVVRARVLVIRYRIYSFVLLNPTGNLLKTFSSYANPFYKNK